MRGRFLHCPSAAVGHSRGAETIHQRHGGRRVCVGEGADRCRKRRLEKALLRGPTLQSVRCFVWRRLAGLGNAIRIRDIAIERGLEKVTEATNSAPIIDLAAHRSARRQQQTRASSEHGSAAAISSVGNFAMPLFWFWPTWVWVAVPVPAASAAQWDAS